MAKKVRPNNKVKLLFRFLKEKNAFTAFLKNLRDPSTQNSDKKETRNINYLNNITDNNFSSVINLVLRWVKTCEGWTFWKKLNDEFYEYFNVKYKNENNQ